MIHSSDHGLCNDNQGVLQAGIHEYRIDGILHRVLEVKKVFPRTSSAYKWIRGGDLLFASGVLFSLLQVRFMLVSEGSRMLIQEAERELRPDYFYYNKTILSRAISVDVELRFEEDEFGDSEIVSEIIPLPNRSVDMIGSWMWDKENKSCT